MKHSEALHQGFIIAEDNTIKPYTYADFLNKFYCDFTTSPIGRKPRIFAARNEVMRWVGTSKELLRTLESESEAELTVLDYRENYYLEYQGDGPTWYPSEKEALEVIAERSQKAIAVIRRFQTMKEATRKRLLKEREAQEVERESFKEKAQAEAEQIVPDEQFFLDLQANKGNRETYVQLFTDLLNRIGHFPIQYDFWLCFREAKKKAIKLYSFVRN